ncbi:hypothetical protein CPB84DRAFT_1891013 [Gymnopilus junonius]|uniref:L domain-like protein n=1 Tax=Gymnopilus junonius TaxID=109634 RepID=A0A9P5TQN8_GYMJU|nr:hypothetical protein CPB84DRAFT_1891013 [Gymnopilus junonius]
MSRIPQPSSSRSTLKPPTTPGKSRIATSTSPMRARTPSSARAITPTPTKPKIVEKEKTPAREATSAMSIKEAIALKRAEAKKAQKLGGGSGLDSLGALEDVLPNDVSKAQEEEDLLGRLSVHDAIEQARSTGRRRGGDKPAWFEAQDLTVLKAWNNDIQEIQHEISLFGSLKTIDLSLLPTTFANLTSLTVLDLSHNALTSLPEKIFALPELTTLNISHNQLTSLPNGRQRRTQQSSGGFFTPVVTHSTTPLPNLLITSTVIHDSIPVSLTKLDLSANPLGPSEKLLKNLSTLKRLKELKFEKSEIGDDSFSPTLFSSAPFVALRLLDLSETQANLDSVKEALKGMKQELDFNFSTDDPPDGVTRVLVGKRILKEPWELELERREKAKATPTSSLGDWEEPAPQPTRSTPTPSGRSSSASQAKASSPPQPAKPRQVVKEAWEIEAEQGLLTEGGRRRARAAAVAKEQATQVTGFSAPSDTSSPSAPSPSPSVSSSLSNPQYYTQNTQTLKLPASAPPTKSLGHARAFSMAAPSASSSFSSARTEDLVVPTPTLPLSVIVAQPFAQSLRVLILANRRMDRTFSLPVYSDSLSGFLPNLEELDLEGCNLNDLVPVYQASDATSGTNSPPRSNELIIPTLTRLFPSLRTLNLSYNAITNASLTGDALSTLMLTSPHRKGLRHLRLRGNRISELDGFLGLAEAFKGNRQVPEWKLEELDLRDNEIGKLPPELGLLPLDVFLVDGNTFRVPQRRVWEREGTKGLLSWLRGRIE